MPHIRSRTIRRGISLIEVLMSIFIISIGLLGVAALIPLAHFLANRGATADRAAAAGLAAQHEAKILNVDNPQTWRQPAGTFLSLAPADSGAAAPLELAGSKKYCLDPRGVARGVSANFPAVGNATTSGGTVTLPRITLYDGRVLANASNAMLTAQADQTFSIHDDLVFTVVDNDPTAVPVQTLEGSSEKRFSSRDFSWLATLVREQAGTPYTLSVAVVQGRNGVTAAEMANLEAEFSVVFASGGLGFGGGDVTLTAVAATKPVLDALVPGNWIMLNQTERARWYRVVTVGEPYGTSLLQRDITLAGRDWDPSGGYNTPKAAVLANVIGVYERTIRLKTNSLWQP